MGVKFIPEDESEQDSEEEPGFDQCHIERQTSEKISQATISNDMTPLAQPNSEAWAGGSEF